MGLKLRNPFTWEKRTSSNSHDERFWASMFGRGTATKSGETITPDNSLEVSTVYACVKVLAETVASLPVFLFKRKDDGSKEIAVNHPVYTLLHGRPNDHMTPFEFKELQMQHLLLRGNFYGFKEINGAGRVVNVIALPPDKMEVLKFSGEIVYRYTFDDGLQKIIPNENIWHIKGLTSSDGLVGLSPISLAREAIGLAKATEGHGASLFENNAMPGGVLEHPGTLSEEGVKRLKETWQNSHAGGGNAHSVAVLEQGLAWKAMGFSNEDSQFLETRNFQVEDIARIFRVPPFLIGHSDKTSTFASAEQSMLSFTMHTIRPWLERIEQSADKNLLTEKEQKRYFVEFKIDALLRGDTLTRFEAYGLAKQNKIFTTNEIRGFENMNPIEGGNVLENPNIAIESTPEPENIEEEDDEGQ